MKFDNVPHGNDPRQRQWVDQMLKDNPAPNWGPGRVGPIKVDVEVTQEDIDNAGPFKLAAGCLILGVLGVMAIGTVIFVVIAVVALSSGDPFAAPTDKARWTGTYTCADGEQSISVETTETLPEPTNGGSQIPNRPFSAEVTFEDRTVTRLRGERVDDTIELTGPADDPRPHGIAGAVGQIDDAAGTLNLFVDSPNCSGINLTKS